MNDQDNSQQDEIEIEAIGIEVSSQPIELYKVFKIANLVGGGGEAKHIISEGYVAVNGEVELRKRRKMYDGDLIEFDQEYYVVVLNTEQDFGEQWVEEDDLSLGEQSQGEIPQGEFEYTATEESFEQAETELEAQHEATFDDEPSAEEPSVEEQTETEQPKKKGRKSLDFL